MFRYANANVLCPVRSEFERQRPQRLLMRFSALRFCLRGRVRSRRRANLGLGVRLVRQRLARRLPSHLGYALWAAWVDFVRGSETSRRSPAVPRPPALG